MTNLIGTRSFITFIDDHNRICWMYLVREKSEAGRVFKELHNMVKTQFQPQIQVFDTDDGREYFNTTLGPLLKEHGIVHQSSCIDTPQQNGMLSIKIDTY